MSVVTFNDHIELTPHMAGGKPRIAGRRIMVEDVVIWEKASMKLPLRMD